MYTKYSNLFIITILEANELSKVAIIIIINLSTSNFTNATTISIKNYWKCLEHNINVIEIKKSYKI